MANFGPKTGINGQKSNKNALLFEKSGQNFRNLAQKWPKLQKYKTSFVYVENQDLSEFFMKKNQKNFIGCFEIFAPKVVMVKLAFQRLPG